MIYYLLAFNSAWNSAQKTKLWILPLKTTENHDCYEYEKCSSCLPSLISQQRDVCVFTHGKLHRALIHALRVSCTRLSVTVEHLFLNMSIDNKNNEEDL